MGELITPRVSGRVSAHLHCCSWHVGPASWRGAVNAFVLYKEHLFPETRAVPGHSRMTEDLAVAVEMEPLEVIRPLPK